MDLTYFWPVGWKLGKIRKGRLDEVVSVWLREFLPAYVVYARIGEGPSVAQSVPFDQWPIDRGIRNCTESVFDVYLVDCRGIQMILHAQQGERISTKRLEDRERRSSN